MALTMGTALFLIAFLGSSVGPAATRALRRWSRHIQFGGAIVIVLVGSALIANGVSPGLWMRLILGP